MAFQNESQTKTKIFIPKIYRVILLNDDVTTMDFVVMILMEIFEKTRDEAINIMLHIHKNGSGICVSYIKEIAETKKDEVKMLAKKANFPLVCEIEEE